MCLYKKRLNSKSYWPWFDIIFYLSLAKILTINPLAFWRTENILFNFMRLIYIFSVGIFENISPVDNKKPFAQKKKTSGGSYASFLTYFFFSYGILCHIFYLSIFKFNFSRRNRNFRNSERGQSLFFPRTYSNIFILKKITLSWRTLHLKWQ